MATNLFEERHEEIPWIYLDGNLPAFQGFGHASLETYPGEVLGLMGESGAGKTTKGRTLVGLVPIKSGPPQVVDFMARVAFSKQDFISARQCSDNIFQDTDSSLNSP